MDNNVFTFENPSDSLMDFDYMDELLLDGCWLQATDGSEITNNNSSPSNSIFDPSFQWPNLESNIGKPVSKDLFAPARNSSNTHVKNLTNQSEDHSESSKRWWIPPSVGSTPSLSVMERLFYAIDNIKHYTVDKNVLIQVWLPRTKDGKKVLSTSQQLFSLELNCPRLSNYRSISEGFDFPAEGNAKESVGLPGRVFKEKVPEWTPDVRLFKQEEYPRVTHAQEQDVRGSVAVPVFDQDVKNCIGVVEVVMTTQKSIYALEIQSVCKALEAVDLMSSKDSNTQGIKANNGFYHPALPEILETLKSACMIHKLPLAQTWAPCIQQGGKGGCRHSNENLVNCLSTVDPASYVSNPRFKEFQEACSAHHLFKGQGVVGRAFTTNEPCYSPDVTSYTKTEYPLAHHASFFDLHAAVAIRLRTNYSDNVDFVLEFFLPVDECKNHEDQKRVIDSLLIIIQKVCRSLRVVTEMELHEEAVNEGLLLVSDTEKVPKIQENEPGPDPGPGSGLGSGLERRRAGAKMEKSITLDMLRQHFAGSLKDAAKNIGVCPTTLKRICRGYGIQRWPSRKIKKVGHSLKKIQLVMDSVHGGPGSFQMESFYSNFPKLASSNPSTTTRLPFSAPKIEPFDSKVNDGGATVISCSPSSSSSHSFSGGTHEVPPVKEDPGNQDQDNKQEQEHERNLFLRSLNEPVKCQNRPPKPSVKREGDLWRVKVTFGEEKIRFRMQKDWGYNELLQEISKRFSLNDISGYQVRYLDDDSEWVLLTCDADVEECIDVYRSFKSGTIRLALREPQIRVGSSLGSNTLL